VACQQPAQEVLRQNLQSITSVASSCSVTPIKQFFVQTEQQLLMQLKNALKQE